MAVAHDVQILRSAFYVGRRRPLSDLPWWKRWLVRTTYFAVGWCTGDGIEAQAICTTRELAEEMAAKPGWFVHELPINTALPDETCRYKLHVFPGSDANHRYQAFRLPLTAVNTREVEQKIDQIIRSASA